MNKQDATVNPVEFAGHSQVADEIEKSENKDAATFERFNDELQKPEPKKPIPKALWDGVVNAPTVGPP